MTHRISTQATAALGRKHKALRSILGLATFLLWNANTIMRCSAFFVRRLPLQTSVKRHSCLDLLNNQHGAFSFYSSATVSRARHCSATPRNAHLTRNGFTTRRPLTSLASSTFPDNNAATTNETSLSLAQSKANQNNNIIIDKDSEDEQDEILVTNADSLPMGFKEGFAIVSHFAFPVAQEFDLSRLQLLADKDIQRLQLTTNNITLPVALMLMDPQKFSTLSRARKFCRNGRILLHRGPLGIDEKTGEANVFIRDNCHMGKVGDRVYPGGKLC